MRENEYGYHMPVDLEKHLENLAESYPKVRELHSLWLLLRKRIEEELTHCGSIFVNYSLHDGSHSRSVIQAVERFLGEERIGRLSATDTFMLLACIYSHDYGMSQTFNKIYDILGHDSFKASLMNIEKNSQWMEKEDEQALHILLQYLNEEKTSIPLNDLYYSIMLVVQLYLRPEHWKGVLRIKRDFEGLFQGHLKKRFICGMEGIAEICMCHGQPMEHILQLSYCADGMAGDQYHPRFIASMLRLGDSLDLDNGRFPMWFVREVALNRNIIPRLSLLHFRKHEAISHLLITPEAIEITAHCASEQTEENEGNRHKQEVEEERASQESYEVAELVYEWTDGLTKECKNIVMNWSRIAQPDFGNPPAHPRVVIFVDGKEYTAENQRLQMRMPHERIMKLLEGSNIYEECYVGIRELLQNAVDASLLQLWSDLMQNRYSYCGLSKDRVKEGLDLWNVKDGIQASIFENYDITVEVIEDRLRNQVMIVVKDKGIGITIEEMKYIAEIGSSKEKNERIRKTMESMPAWLKPSGIFGIGLQSVFQMTDCIEFYTRQHNTPEQHILINSYGKNKGKIEFREVPAGGGETYFDNAIPGTNVKIAIDPDKFLSKGFQYYDPEFDTGEKLHMLFIEVAQACREKIREVRYDYFNIFFQSMILEEDGTKKIDYEEPKRFRSCYIDSKDLIKRVFGEQQKIASSPPEETCVFADNGAYFWDRKTNRCYLLRVVPCRIAEKDGKNIVSLPERIPTVYDINYKFNKIYDTEVVYARRGQPQSLHAGFFSMDVLILDDQPEKYIQIDRGRLREGAIDEEELLMAQREIMSRWCIDLCERKAAVERKIRASIRASAKAADKSPEEMRGILISQILLFYRNVPEDLFRKFIGAYEDMINSWNLLLETDEIPLRALWHPENLFQTQVDIPNNLIKRMAEQKEQQNQNLAQEVQQNVEQEEQQNVKQEVRQETIQGILQNVGQKVRQDTEQEPCSTVNISMDNIQRLPHRIVSIKKIKCNEDKICYDLKLQSARKKIESIDMSEEACLLDYMGAFEYHQNNPEGIKFDTLPKKVFKPDSRFENLLLHCYPRTFRRGRNMSGYLDSCVKTYILSPLDERTAIILGRGLDKDDDVWIRFNEKVMESDQMDKCVAYIMKKRYADCEDQLVKELAVRQDYERFLEQFYRILWENRKLVLNQFKVN